MRLVARRDLQGGGLDLDEVLRRRTSARNAAVIAVARQQERPPVGMDVGRPPGRRSGSGRALAVPRPVGSTGQAGDLLRKIRYSAAAKQFSGVARAGSAAPRRAAICHKERFVKVIASSLRKGNVVDMDGKLYVVLTAENIHPGKGTPVDPARHAPHLRRREGLRALGAPPSRSSAPSSRTASFTFLYPGRRGLSTS